MANGQIASPRHLPFVFPFQNLSKYVLPTYHIQQNFLGHIKDAPVPELSVFPEKINGAFP
jgi:hypothetical protein